MIAFLGVLTAVFCIFVFLIKRDILHPLFCFDSVWAAILLLFSLNLVGFVDINSQTIIVLYIMVLVPNFTVLSYSLLRQSLGLRIKARNMPRLSDGYDFSLRKNLFIFMICVSLGVMLIDEFEILLNIIQGKSFKQIMIATGGKGTVEIKGAVRVSLYLFLVHPMQYMCSPICAVEYFKNKRKFYLVLNLLYVFLAVIHHGGRNAIFLFMITYFAAIIKKRGGETIAKKIKENMKYIIPLFALVYIVFTISSSRGIDDVWLSFYIYFTCCIPLTSKYLDLYLNSFVGKTLGMWSFRGLAYPFFSVAQFFGMPLPESYKMANEIETIVESNYLPISSYSKIGTNSFMFAGVSPFLDGGYLGEIVVLFLASIAVYNSYLKFKRCANEKTMSLYFLMLPGIILSFMRFFMSSYGYALALVYLSTFMYKKEKYKPAL